MSQDNKDRYALNSSTESERPFKGYVNSPASSLKMLVSSTINQNAGFFANSFYNLDSVNNLMNKSKWLIQHNRIYDPSETTENVAKGITDISILGAENRIFIFDQRGLKMLTNFESTESQYFAHNST